MSTDAELIADDWAHLTQSAGEFALTFYATLFDLAPAVRPLFPVGMVKQRAKLLAVLAKVVESATDPDFDHDTHVAKLRRLGVRHIGFGAAPEHYPVVGEALLTAMSWMVPGWDEDDRHAAAWGAAYQQTADAMIAAAQQATTDAPAWLDVEVTEIVWTLRTTFVTVGQRLPNETADPTSFLVRRTDFGGDWVPATPAGNWDVLQIDTSGDDLDALVIAAMAPGEQLRVVLDNDQEAQP